MVAEFTAYFRVPAKYCRELKVIFDPDEIDPIILSEGITDPDKIYEIVTMEQPFGIWGVGERFTGKEIEISGKGTIFEVTSPFVFKRKDLPARVVATLDSGLKIVHMHFKRYMVRVIIRLSATDSLDNNALIAAKLVDAYIGKTPQAVFDLYPELMGGITDVYGNYIPYLEQHCWSFE